MALMVLCGKGALAQSRRCRSWRCRRSVSPSARAGRRRRNFLGVLLNGLSLFQACRSRCRTARCGPVWKSACVGHPIILHRYCDDAAVPAARRRWEPASPGHRSASHRWRGRRKIQHERRNFDVHTGGTRSASIADDALRERDRARGARRWAWARRHFCGHRLRGAAARSRRRRANATSASPPAHHTPLVKDAGGVAAVTVGIVRKILTNVRSPSFVAGQHLGSACFAAALAQQGTCGRGRSPHRGRRATRR